MAVMAQITKESPAEAILDLIRGRADFLPINAIHPTGLVGGKRGFVVVNGTMIGTVEDILVVADELRFGRRRGELSMYLGVSVDYMAKTLDLRTDADRLTRPLFNAAVVRKLGDEFRELLVRVRDGRVGWDDLLRGAAAGNKQYVGEEAVLEMIDTHEANNILLVSHPAELATNLDATHCEIHPCTIFGVVASLIP